MASPDNLGSGFQCINFENFRCDRCKNYLSVPPIRTMEQDNKASVNICGRCQIDPADKGLSRNPIFELLAKHINFPCSESPMCTEKLQFGKKILQHELKCKYRRYRCPLCNVQFEVGLFLMHFQEEHGSLVYKDRLVRVDNLFHIYKSSYFLVVSKMNKYFVKIILEGRHISVKLEIFDKTTENHLINVILNGSCHRAEFQESSFSGITMFHKGDMHNVELVIHLIPINEVADNLQFTEVKETVTTSLECPVCCQFMTGRIFVCLSGHSICQSCAEQVTVCPFCKMIFDDTRNFSLEELADKFTRVLSQS